MVNYVKVSDFNISRYKVDPIRNFGNALSRGICSQYGAIPKYIFGEDTISESEKQSTPGEKMIVVTTQIRLDRGCIPRCDGTYRKTENDCMYIWVPLLKDSGGSELYEKVLLPIDKHNLKKIVDEKNKDFLVRIDDGKPKPFKNLKYIPCVREFTPGEGDDDNASDDGSDGEHAYKCVKVRISTKWDGNASKDAEKEIDTNVYLLNEKGQHEKQTVKTMEDLRALVTWKSVIRLALDFNKFWVMKCVEKDGCGGRYRKCGMSIKCSAIFIEEKGPTFSRNTTLGTGVFGNYGSDTEDSESEDENSQENECGSELINKNINIEEQSDEEWYVKDSEFRNIDTNCEMQHEKMNISKCIIS